MTTTVRAHFDGKQSLVLDEPVDLPVGRPLRVHVESVEPSPFVTPTEPSVVDQLPLIRGLDRQVVRQTIDDPENELCNLNMEVFLGDVRGASDRDTAG